MTALQKPARRSARPLLLPMRTERQACHASPALAGSIGALRA